MSDTSGQNVTVDPDHLGGQNPAESQVPEPAPRKRRGLRIVLISLASVVVFLGAVAVGVYLLVNHLESGIHRTPVKVAKPVGKAITVLITGSGIGPTGALKAKPTLNSSGLIMLLHINADGQTGGVVSIPPLAIVPVPGHGRTQINNALAYGGPSLLVQTVDQLSHVPINHYAEIDFTHVGSVINVVGGVNVTLPETAKAFGYTFPAGVNHLNGLTAVYYARQKSLTENGRLLRQQSLIRALADTLANGHLLTNPVTMYNVIKSFTSLLTVDTDFTNADVTKFATQFGTLNSKSGVFLTVPTATVAGKTYFNASMSDPLWTALRKNSIAAFAKKYPSTVTPAAPQ
jgi:LCP family protein required for cell wall assembly